MALSAGASFRASPVEFRAEELLASLAANTHPDGTLRAPPTPPQWHASDDANIAMGALSRYFLGTAPGRGDEMSWMLGEVAASVPEPAAVSMDILFTWVGSDVLHQRGGAAWANWSGTVMPALVAAQRQDGNFKGSFDPVGRDAKVGGRMYQTVLSVLALLSRYRFTQMVR
jgi:hypothetical protein